MLGCVGSVKASTKSFRPRKDFLTVIRDLKPNSIAAALSQEGLFYLDVINQIESIALTHEYSFVDDEFFQHWTRSDSFNVARFNQILSLELINSHILPLFPPSCAPNAGPRPFA